MTDTTCADDPASRSTCMIRIILDDVQKTAGGAGGGISEIKALSSTSYRVSLPREERVAQFTYRFAVRPGAVRLTGRSEDARAY